MFVSLLAPLNLPARWLVAARSTMQVVIVYRRIHSHLPSMYNQRFKMARSDDGHPVGRGHRDWPGINGEIRVPGFVEWLHGWLAGNKVDKHHVKFAPIAQISYNTFRVRLELRQTTFTRDSLRVFRILLGN